jgi:hypothetical protein
MYSRKGFLDLETMCRERAQLAKREFEYWLAEADEWARCKDSAEPLVEEVDGQMSSYREASIPNPDSIR